MLYYATFPIGEGGQYYDMILSIVAVPRTLSSLLETALLRPPVRVRVTSYRHTSV